MGGPKADLVLACERLLDRAVRTLREAGCAPVVAVVRAGAAVPEGAVAAVNPDPERGMRSSLELAVAAAAGADALAVLLVDLPGVPASAVREVVAGWRPGRVAVGRFGEVRAHPTVMAPALWRAALATAGPEEGARAFLRAHAELVDDVAVAGDPADLDLPADLDPWRDR